jgi:Staphylococcal nuclease homologue
VDGMTVEVDERGIDQFGRVLAYLWIAGTDVNLELVEKGLAIATTPNDDNVDSAHLVTAEQTAFDAGLGLWSPSACGGSGVLPGIVVDVDSSQFDAPGPDESALDLEWVTFRSESSVEVSGWTVRDESSLHRCRLGDGDRVTPQVALQIGSNHSCWDPGGSPVWNNGGDLVLLLDTYGRVVARSRYSD